MRKNSIKNTRINAEVMKVLANLIRGEIKTCKVYISVLGDETKREETMEGLRNAEGFMRRQLASTLNLRNTPELKFISDTSTEYGMAMSAKIDEVMAPIHERDGE